MSPSSNWLYFDILHNILKLTDEASLLQSQSVSPAWYSAASIELYSRPIHLRTPGALLKLLMRHTDTREVMPRAEHLRYMRSLVFHRSPAASDIPLLRKCLVSLAGLRLSSIDRVTFEYSPPINTTVNQEEAMIVSMFMRDLLTVIKPRTLGIVGETSTVLPYANLLWQPAHIIMGENHSYEHMLPLWFSTGDRGIGARSKLTAVTIIMSGKFQPRDQPMRLPYRIKGRLFRLLQLLEHARSFVSITVTGIGAISPARVLQDPKLHFNGPLEPWSATLPGCADINFDTERENQDAIAECLKQVAVARGFYSANIWEDRVSFGTHPV